VHPANQS
jgi:hypothetical protein